MKFRERFNYKLLLYKYPGINRIKWRGKGSGRTQELVQGGANTGTCLWGGAYTGTSILRYEQSLKLVFTSVTGSILKFVLMLHWQSAKAICNPRVLRFCSYSF